MLRPDASSAITSRMRLRDHDYAQPGAYFVTVCTARRAPLFGHVEEGVMRQSPAGVVVESWWYSIPSAFPTVVADTMVVMPSHVHGILILGTQPDPSVSQPTLSDVVAWFKSRTTHDYILGVRLEGWPRFERRLWQARFHDHIIRTDRALARIREYILANPSNWKEDPFREG